MQLWELMQVQTYTHAKYLTLPTKYLTRPLTKRLPTERQPGKRTENQDQQIPSQPQPSSETLGVRGIHQPDHRKQKKSNKIINKTKKKKKNQKYQGQSKPHKEKG